MKKLCLMVLFVFLLLGAAEWAEAAADKRLESVMSRWTKKEFYTEKDVQGGLELEITLYSAEYVEALIEAEAEKNLWTADEKEQYKYQLLKTLNLEEYVPFHFSFNNNGPSMHMAPFDKLVSLWMGKKKYEPVDYDKRFNFKLQGRRDGMVWFPRYDEKTGKSLIEGVGTVKMDISGSISPFLSNKQFVSFLWDIGKDNPGRLYEGRAASRLELDRLIKRIEKLNAEKRELETKLNELNNELSSVNKRVEELQKQ